MKWSNLVGMDMEWFTMKLSDSTLCLPLKKCLQDWQFKYLRDNISIIILTKKKRITITSSANRTIVTNKQTTIGSPMVITTDGFTTIPIDIATTTSPNKFTTTPTVNIVDTRTEIYINISTKLGILGEDVIGETICTIYPTILVIIICTQGLEDNLDQNMIHHIDIVEMNLVLKV